MRGGPDTEPRGLARRAWAVLRSGGPRAFLVAVLAETVYRRLDVYELELDGARGETRDGVETRFLAVDELGAYEALRPGHAERARERLERGHRCFAVYVDGELASVRWMAEARPRIEYLGLALDLEPDEVYSYDSFTGERFRRRGLSTLAQRRLALVLREQGVRRIVRAVLPENEAGVRDALKVGYRRAGLIGRLRIGPWRRDLRR